MKKKASLPLIPDKVYNNLPTMLEEITEKFSKGERDVVLTSSLGVISSLLPFVHGEYESNTVYSNLSTIIKVSNLISKNIVAKSTMLAEVIDIKKTDFKLKVVKNNKDIANLKSFVNKTEKGLLILESDPDLVSNKFYYDWSKCSITISEDDYNVSDFLESQNLLSKNLKPQLSTIIISSTEKFDSLSYSEKGMFCQFINYFYDGGTELADFFDPKKDYAFYYYSLVLNDIYSRDYNIEFSLTEDQKRYYNQYFENEFAFFFTNQHFNFENLMKDIGLILIKLCMIISTLRLF